MDIVPLFQVKVQEKIEEDVPKRNEVTGPDTIPKGHKNKEENLFSIVDTAGKYF